MLFTEVSQLNSQDPLGPEKFTLTGEGIGYEKRQCDLEDTLLPGLPYLSQLYYIMFLCRLMCSHHVILLYLSEFHSAWIAINLATIADISLSLELSWRILQRCVGNREPNWHWLICRWMNPARGHNVLHDTQLALSDIIKRYHSWHSKSASRTSTGGQSQQRVPNLAGGILGPSIYSSSSVRWALIEMHNVLGQYSWNRNLIIALTHDIMIISLSKKWHENN